MEGAESSSASSSRAWRRRFGLALGSLLFGMILLVGSEVALRAIGLGAVPRGGESRLRYQRVVLPALRPRARPDGTATLSPADPRIPFQSVLAAKPADGLRVVTFGGSATAGLGFSPNVTFAHHLEELLVRALPGLPVEVLNLGVVAFSSGQVAAMVEDVVQSAVPDLVIVYSGNNEFLELHAKKYADLDATWATRVRDRLSDTNVYRALVGLAGRRGGPTSVGRVSEEELQLSEDVLIRDIEVRDEEIEQVLDAYAANLELIAQAAAARGVPVLFLTVATNWEWRGRSDLPAGWLDDLLGEAGPASDDRLRAGVARLDERLATLEGFDRHEDLFKRAELHAALGETARARDDYRAAMNHDPHLRRALDAGNARVLEVADRAGALALDAVEFLAARSRDGIVGFDEFYDYVHFTPEGAARLALGIYGHLVVQEIFRPAAGFDAEGEVDAFLARLAQREEDFLEVNDWIGFCFDRSLLTDRDLWKYDHAIQALDARLAANASDFAAFVYRGNAASFRHDGASAAAADYRAALALDPDSVAVRQNLEALLAERRAE